MRVLVFDDDQALRELFRKILQGFGHNVTAYADPTLCPAYQSPKCECPADKPCAEAMIIDVMMPNMSGIDLLKAQRERGCKALDQNKALMSAANKPEFRDTASEFGCRFLKKPFKISEVRVWLEECSNRLSS
jgi:CheY-like chemotaxis protein